MTYRLRKLYNVYEDSPLKTPFTSLGDPAFLIYVSHCLSFASMEPSLQQLLTKHNIPPKVIKKLKKQGVTEKKILKSMNDSDLSNLKEKCKLKAGEAVNLSSAREELKRNNEPPDEEEENPSDSHRLLSPKDYERLADERKKKQSVRVPDNTRWPRRIRSQRLRLSFKKKICCCCK